MKKKYIDMGAIILDQETGANIPKSENNADYIRALKEVENDKSEIVQPDSSPTEGKILNIEEKLNKKNIVYKSVQYSSTEESLEWLNTAINNFDLLLDNQNTERSEPNNTELSWLSAANKEKLLIKADLVKILEKNAASRHKNQLKRIAFKTKLDDETLTEQELADWENS